MNFVISQMKALGERNRLRAFLALTATGELCVCQVGELLSLSPATVSRHMSILGAAGLVEWEKRGKWVYYRLSKTVAPYLMEWILESVRDNAAFAGDRNVLASSRFKESCCGQPERKEK
jgi:DNA-binding transcriptional ArsR family regulator